jgi:hypothetical protein
MWENVIMTRLPGEFTTGDALGFYVNAVDLNWYLHLTLTKVCVLPSLLTDSPAKIRVIYLEVGLRELVSRRAARSVEVSVRIQLSRSRYSSNRL